MSMAAWAATDAFRHPWVAVNSMKRKHSDSSSDDEAPTSILAQDQDDFDAMPTVYPTPPLEPITRGRDAEVDGHEGHAHGVKKRRRYDLENKMSRLRIEQTKDNDGPRQQYTVEDDLDLANAEPFSLPPPVVPRLIPLSQANSTSSTTSNSSYATAKSYAYTSGSISPVPRGSILAEYAIEEPVSPEFDARVALPPNDAESSAPEVRMKGSDPAYYELDKNRLVITDLDEYVQEVENEEKQALEDEYKSEAEPHPDASEYADSNADYSISSVLLDHIKRQPTTTQIPILQREKERGALILFRPLPVSFSLPLESTSDRSKKDDVQVEEIDVDSERISTPPGGFEVGTVSEIDGEPMDMDMDVDM